ncbi:MAG: RluA family pseudouridine synthase [Bacilli bacterium]|nr:RluA family pseudouridine synthase [Bacilli bacterium]
MEIVIEEDLGVRIDSYLSNQLDYSRSKIVKMINDGTILVNGKSIKNSYSLKKDDVITIGEYIEEEMNIEPENIPLDIVYEDEDVIVVNKPNGMVVHPAIGNNHGTLVNALLYYSKKLSNINGEFRPGIVHRIDAYTTGLLMVAKTNKSHEILAEQLSKKETTRRYIALVWGVIKEDTATIDAPIGRDSNDRKKMAVTSINSKDAVTHLKVLKRFKDATLIELQLETGRTHQIRVHMNYINHPVVNDPVYGRRKLIDETGQCLHAYQIGFNHPTTNKYMEFKCELPECFKNILDMFEEESI